jgi:hypothetical protein
MRPQRPAFTLIDATATFAALTLFTATGIVAFGNQPESPTAEQRTARDLTQLRGLAQACTIWAQNVKDNRYPLPSDIDVGDNTVAERGRTKDTTGNIYSLLVFNGSISTEMLISPFELNTKVVLKDDYEFSNPKKAVKPEAALWDPALTASLGAEQGHISYAHLQPAAARLKRWSATNSPTDAVFSTRGPEISAVAHSDQGAAPTFANPESLTLKMLGDGKTWRGHVAYADNRVSRNVEYTSAQPYATDKLTYTPKDAAGADQPKRPDILFHDDADDPDHANLYLGIFTRAGQRPDEWRAIWD